MKSKLSGLFDNKILHSIFICIIIVLASSLFIYRNFLMFHTLAEFVRVITAFIMASISIIAYKINNNRSIIFLGIAYGFIGIFDLIHIFAYKDIGGFADNTSNISTQIWIVARYIESISLLVFLVIKDRRINIKRVFYSYLGISLLLLFLILYLRVFPCCITDDLKITLFKKINEYIVIGVFIIGIIYLIGQIVQNKEDLKKTYISLILSLITSAISEMFFLFQFQSYNLTTIGIVFKLISYYYVYKALVRKSLEEPYMNMAERNNSLSIKNSNLQNLYDELKLEYEYRRKLEKENSKKTQILNGILESSMYGILVIDNKRRILHSNNKFLQMMNIQYEPNLEGDLSQLLNYIKSNLINPEEFDIFIRRSLNSNDTQTYQFKFKDNRIFEISTLPFIDSGVKEGVVVNCRDITKKVTIEELQKNIEIRQALLIKAKEVDNMKTSFFMTISHEIRTPINIMLGTVQLMKSLEDGDSENTQDVLSDSSFKALRKNCYRLIKLADNLIDITKIDSGDMSLDLQNHDIVSTIEEVVYSVKEYIKDRNISIIFNTDRNERIMAFDISEIERVMLNLLSNAVKFTKFEGNIEVNIKNKKEIVILSVKDNGIGIPEHMIDKVFDTMKQVDTSLRRNNEGIGIGLSIVKSIVEMHGGSIYLNSNVNIGSEFIIELPVYLVDNKKQKNMMQVDKYMGIDRVNIEFSDIYELN